MQLNELPILHAHRCDEPRQLLLVFPEEVGARVPAAAASFGATQGTRSWSRVVREAALAELAEEAVHWIAEWSANRLLWALWRFAYLTVSRRYLPQLSDATENQLPCSTV